MSARNEDSDRPSSSSSSQSFGDGDDFKQQAPPDSARGSRPLDKRQIEEFTTRMARMKVMEKEMLELKKRLTTLEDLTREELQRFDHGLETCLHNTLNVEEVELRFASLQSSMNASIDTVQQLAGKVDSTLPGLTKRVEDTRRDAAKHLGNLRTKVDSIEPQINAATQQLAQVQQQMQQVLHQQQQQQQIMQQQFDMGTIVGMISTKAAEVMAINKQAIDAESYKRLEFQEDTRRQVKALSDNLQLLSAQVTGLAQGGAVRPVAEVFTPTPVGAGGHSTLLGSPPLQPPSSAMVVSSEAGNVPSSELLARVMRLEQQLQTNTQACVKLRDMVGEQKKALADLSVVGPAARDSGMVDELGLPVSTNRLSLASPGLPDGGLADRLTQLVDRVRQLEDVIRAEVTKRAKQTQALGDALQTSRHETGDRINDMFGKCDEQVKAIAHRVQEFTTQVDKKLDKSARAASEEMKSFTEMMSSMAAGQDEAYMVLSVRVDAMQSKTNQSLSELQATTKGMKKSMVSSAQLHEVRDRLQATMEALLTDGRGGRPPTAPEDESKQQQVDVIVADGVKHEEFRDCVAELVQAISELRTHVTESKESIGHSLENMGALHAMCTNLQTVVAKQDREHRLELDAAKLESQQHTQRMLAGAKAELEEAIRQKLEAESAATKAVLAASQLKLFEELRSAIEAEEKSRREALGMLHSQVTATSKAEREVVGNLQLQVEKLGGALKACSRQAQDASDAAAAVSQKNEELQTQTQAWMKSSVEEQAALREAAHANTLNTATARIESVRRAMSELVSSHVTSALAVHETRTSTMRLELNGQMAVMQQELQHTRTRLDTTRAELQAHMDSQYQDIKSKLLESGNANVLVAREAEERKADTQQTRQAMAAYIEDTKRQTAVQGTLDALIMTLIEKESKAELADVQAAAIAAHAKTSGSVLELESQQATLAASMSSLNGQMQQAATSAAVAQTVEPLAKKLEGLSAEVERLQHAAASVTSPEQALEPFTKKLDGLSAEVEQLEKQVAEAVVRGQAHQASIAQLGSEVSAVKQLASGSSSNKQRETELQVAATVDSLVSILETDALNATLETFSRR